MRTIVFLVGAALAMPAVPAEAQEAPASELVLGIMARRYDTAGRYSAGAGDHGGKEGFQSYVYATTPGLCGLGASDNLPKTVPPVGWHFSGQVLGSTRSAAGEALLVRIEWRRQWDRGGEAGGDWQGSASISMREGDVLVLDRVAPWEDSACNAAEVRLEATVVARPRRFGPYGALGVVGRIGAGGAGGGVGGGRGGVAGGRGGASGGVAAGELRGRVEEMASAIAAARARFEGELWLVHRQPDGVERVQQQTIRFGTSGTSWAFPPVPVPTGQGVVTIDLSGSLRLIEASRITVMILRRARVAGSASDTQGGTGKIISLPAPTDVLSFEFPALPKATEDLLAGHTFSIRLRVKSVGG